MKSKETKLCFSGYTSEDMPRNEEDYRALQLKLKKEIEDAIKHGINTFYFSAWYGFDLMCANIILQRKKIINIFQHKSIKLVAVIPYEEQAKNWKEQHRELYYNTLAQCDDVITLNTRFHLKSNDDAVSYMVDRCSNMLCYYDGSAIEREYVIQYAKLKHLDIKNVYES